MTIQLKKEKDKNDKLASMLTNEKNKNEILTNQLNNGKRTIDNLSQENKKLNEKLEGLQLQLQQRNNQYLVNSNNSNEITQLYKQIYNLNETLKRYPVILEENEKLISIIFASSDQTMHYSMICKNTDTISYLEPKLYKEFPSFVESDNMFLCKGTVINKYKTFESYKIKNGDILILNKRDD